LLPLPPLFVSLLNTVKGGVKGFQWGGGRGDHSCRS
jgi:hypothetical protein